MQEEKRYAVLIDADNIAPKYIGSILNEISNKGIITYKRIYADWTSTNASSWKKVLLQYALTPVQQYSYTYSGFQEFHRLCHDYRCDGYSLFRPCGRFRIVLFRQ